MNNTQTLHFVRRILELIAARGNKSVAGLSSNDTLDDLALSTPDRATLALVMQNMAAAINSKAKITVNDLKTAKNVSGVVKLGLVAADATNAALSAADIDAVIAKAKALPANTVATAMGQTATALKTASFVPRQTASNGPSSAGKRAS